MQSLGAALVVSSSRSADAARTSALAPDLVVIVIDDMRWDVMGCAGHPVVRTPNLDRIAARGVRFENAFVTTSLCSPSRASILTGMYANKHGVIATGLTDPDASLPTFPQLLQTAGYRTAMIGKWHMHRDPNPRPGFDDWLSFMGQGRYIDPVLNRNGTTYQAAGYMTDLLTDAAVDFLRRPRGGPFCLYLAHKAVHGDFVPAPRHANLYADANLPDPVFDTLEGKPRWFRESGPRSRSKNLRWQTPEQEAEHWRSQSLAYYRTLAAVDESVGQVLDTLDEIGRTNQTLVLLTSDNGLMLGEHGRGAKRTAYEESIRVPLLAAGVGVRDGGRAVSELVLNIDLAPTFLELAGIPTPPGMQGRSLAPLLADETPAWRQSFLYEYFREKTKPSTPTIRGVRTQDWKYTRVPGTDDIDELYHLAVDPHELHNLIADPGSQKKLVELQTELARLRRQFG